LNFGPSLTASARATLCASSSPAARIIVASGAHPRYARKLGSGEPLADAVTFAIAQQEIFHDPDHPSRILLPIRIGKDSPPRPTLVMGLRVLAQDIGPKRFTTANKGMDG